MAIIEGGAFTGFAVAMNGWAYVAAISVDEWKQWPFVIASFVLGGVCVYLERERTKERAAFLKSQAELKKLVQEYAERREKDYEDMRQLFVDNQKVISEQTAAQKGCQGYRLLNDQDFAH